MFPIPCSPNPTWPPAKDSVSQQQEMPQSASTVSQLGTSKMVHPILDMRASVLLLRLSLSCYPPLDSETRWTGELWPKTSLNIIRLKKKKKTFFLNLIFFTSQIFFAIFLDFLGNRLCHGDSADNVWAGFCAQSIKV